MPVTNYIYNPLTEAYLMETDEDGNLTAWYTQEPVKYGDVLAQHRIDPTTGVGQSFYYHTDALGSTRELTDTSGTVVNTYTYDAFGNTIASTGTVENPFRFTGNVGYYFDEELDTYHIRARNYQPTTGRWMSQDPIGFASGINLYGAYFVPNTTDPSGEAAPVLGAAGIILAAVFSCVYPFHMNALKGFRRRSDKFRHCLVSCQTAKLCGALISEAAGIGKEVRDRAVHAYCLGFPDHAICKGGHNDFWDSMDDLAANQACIGWETWIGGPVGWLGACIRRSCEDCCTDEIGR